MVQISKLKNKYKTIYYKKISTTAEKFKKSVDTAVAKNNELASEITAGTATVIVGLITCSFGCSYKCRYCC
jgi:tRNA A37 methylthiotransferase MiaB